MINEIRSFSAEKNKIKLNISLFIIGKDVLLILSGGTHPHIGSLTFLTETENIKNHNFPSHDGRRHKDGELSDRIAQKIQNSLEGSCVITSGVHFDGISWEEIQTCFDLSDALGNQINYFLKNYNYQTSDPKYQKLKRP